MLDFVLKTKLVRVKRKLRSTECIVFSLRKSKPFGYNSGSVFIFSVLFQDLGKFVARGCGRGDFERTCRGLREDGQSVSVCACAGDGCNGATGIGGAAVGVTVALAALAQRILA